MDLVVSVTNPCSNGDHRDVNATIDGVSVSDRFHNDELMAPLTADDRMTLLRLMVRLLRRSGVTIGNFTGRVLRGDEATNVKMYQFFGPGAAITKTNIGASYVNICPGLNGERVAVDLTGCTQYRLILHANLIGTGQWGARVVRDSDNAVLHESANLGAAGERELDSDWQNLPAAFLNQGFLYLRAQGKSTTAADDPVFRSLVLGLR